MISSLFSVVAFLAVCGVSQHVSGVFSDFKAFVSLDLSLTPPSFMWTYQLQWQLSASLVHHGDTFYLAMPCVSPIAASKTIFLTKSEKTYASCVFVLDKVHMLQCTASKEVEKSLSITGVFEFNVLPPPDASCLAEAGSVSVSHGSCSLTSVIYDTKLPVKRAESSPVNVGKKVLVAKKSGGLFHFFHFVKRMEDWEVLTMSEYSRTTLRVTKRVTSTRVKTSETVSVVPVTTITESRVVLTLSPSTETTTEEPSPTTTNPPQATSTALSNLNVVVEEVFETVVVTSVETQTLVLLSLVSSSSEETAETFPETVSSERRTLAADDAVVSEEYPSPSSLSANPTSSIEDSGVSSSPNELQPALILSPDPSRSLAQSELQSALTIFSGPPRSLALSELQSALYVDPSRSLALSKLHSFLIITLEPLQSLIVSELRLTVNTLQNLQTQSPFMANSLMFSTRPVPIHVKAAAFYTTLRSKPSHNGNNPLNRGLIGNGPHEAMVNPVSSSDLKDLQKQHPGSDDASDEPISRGVAQSSKNQAYRNSHNSGSTDQDTPINSRMNLNVESAQTPRASKTQSSLSTDTYNMPKELKNSGAASLLCSSKSVRWLVVSVLYLVIWM